MQVVWEFVAMRAYQSPAKELVVCLSQLCKIGRTGAVHQGQVRNQFADDPPRYGFGMATSSP
ncbi:hypothetical protein GCM10010862_42190 [Devosia nitrariae]|uniref:Uncharacterized protein n=1 Tax=Devosia nitrariae TaxID=2071872 RepID=A0ABQ5WA32_9HYPH|nr:hypothetical protein GCM10010862_42190 [Devosia nitrariae]